jgi:hypothetical protein
VTRSPPHIDLLDVEHKTFCSMISALRVEMTRVLTGHISQKNLDGLAFAAGYFESQANIGRAVLQPELSVELGKMADSLRIMYAEIAVDLVSRRG